MKSLFLTFMMVIISSAVFASEIDGKWIEVYQKIGQLIFEFRVEGKKLYGIALLGSGAEKKRYKRAG